MIFETNRLDFLLSLRKVLSIVESRVNIPILSNVLMEAGENCIVLTTTNLDVSIQSKCMAKIECSGSATLPIRKLFTIVRSLSNLAISLILLEGNKVQIGSGSAQYIITGIDEGQFPRFMPRISSNQIMIDQDILIQAFRCVSYAQSMNVSQKILNGVLIDILIDKIIFVATDGKRLARYTVTSTSNSIQSFIISTRTVTELQRLLGQGNKVVFNLDENQLNIFIQNNETSLESSYDHIFTKTLEGRFPGYNELIPSMNEKINIQQGDLQGGIRRASIVTNADNRYITLKINKNALNIISFSSGTGSYHESIPAKYKGPAYSISFNPDYILDALKPLAVSDLMSFEFGDSYSPGILTANNNFLCMIMPLRIQDNSSI